MKKLKFIMPALALAMCMSAFIFAGGATALAYDGENAENCVHEYMKETHEATCTETGYTEYVCSKCGDSYKVNFTELKPHNYTKTETKPTCTEKGFITYVCNDCGYTYASVNADETGHDFGEISVPSDCTHKGYTSRYFLRMPRSWRLRALL